MFDVTMADTQNPIQNDNTTNPGSMGIGGAATNDSTQTQAPTDLLGDISLDIPAAPEAAASSGVSDLGDMLVEKSMDNAQQKAESTPVADAQTPVSTPTNDLTIDLSGIDLPGSNDISIPSSTEGSSASTTSESDSQQAT